MLVTVLILVSLVTCSLAQTECDTANQTLYMDSDCLEALSAVLSDGANSTTNATAVTMVCRSDTTCYQNIRGYLDNCPVSIYIELSRAPYAGMARYREDT